MAKLILSLNETFKGEYPVNKDRITIGRRPANDIHLDNLAVSGYHAAIVTIDNESFLEDLDSTNGTFVNGRAIKRHMLRNSDRIEFGSYQLRYVNPGAVPSDSNRPEIETVPAEKSAGQEPAPVPENPPKINTPVPDLPLNAPVSGIAAPAKVLVLNGAGSGRELELNKTLTTLGKPGMQVAVITKRPQGYYFSHVEGQDYPIVNGVSIGAQARQLNNHDVLELAGVKMEFYLGQD